MIDKLKKIKLLVLDVDGVLTDGRIIVGSRGEETKNFYVQDGFALVAARSVGLKTAILSARISPPVKHRAKDLKFDKVCQGAYPKLNVYEKMLKEFKLTDAEVCFVGDDIPDLKVMIRAGFSATVPHAPVEIKRAADYVTKKEAGRGAVREVIELILKTQGKWKKVIESC